MYRRVTLTVPPAGLQGHPTDAGAGLGPEETRPGELRRRPDGGEAAPLPGRAGGAAVRADAGVHQTQQTVPGPGPRPAVSSPGVQVQVQVQVRPAGTSPGR